MPEKFVTIMTYERANQAQYHKEVLENAGIKAILTGRQSEEISSPDTLPLSGGPVYLRVPENQALAAGQALEEHLDEMTGGNPAVE